ncbi:autotransporter outer membrane beta-barrel domain-containing protein [Brevundimonas sp.]|uniref:autotransporter outer membrane beta-barrel domain-containing protein n=1 Tax=Brevundimonas sp. TaxID=1871086 RepID=UPI00286A40BF|nr:autotransporter outer membrane beta-barrel domain-containing protein [Brevundimonas sp.]
MEASRAGLDAFSETGASFYALSYEAMDLQTLTGNLGIRLDWSMQARETVFMPSIRVEWRHEFEEPSADLR